VVLIAAISAVAGCKGSRSAQKRDATPKIADAGPADGPVAISLPPAPPLPKKHRGLPRLPTPARAPTPERVELGRLLFATEGVFGAMTCAGCHAPGDAPPLDQTARGVTNLRNTPPLLDLAYHDSFYRDGRADSVVALLPGHIRGQLGADVAEVAVRLAEDLKWRAHFARAFSAPPTPESVAIALADFALTRYSPMSAWDRHESGVDGAVSAEAIRGAAVFNERAGCAVCHPPPLYTDHKIHPTAVPAGVGPPDPGRARITEAPRDQRAFKTPTLRGLARTGPYFHAGTSATLADAVDVELGRAKPGLTGPTVTAVERAELIAFLTALSP
jgi:cytochrome c peroxidase